MASRGKISWGLIDEAFRVVAPFAVVLVALASAPAYAEEDKELQNIIAEEQPAAVTDKGTESGDGTKFSAEFSAIGRVFFDDGLYYHQSDETIVPIATGRINFTHAWNGGADQLALEAYGRLDEETDTTMFDLPEAYYRHVADNFDFLIGSHIEFWGVTESFNPVNIINQKDNNGDIRGKSSLGQPMANLNSDFGDMGNLSLYALFGFRDQDFGGKSSRFRAPLVTDEDLATYEGSRDVDFAARYSNTMTAGEGSLDFALSYFNGINREAVLLPACVNAKHSPGEALCKHINKGIVKLYKESDDHPLLDHLEDHLDDLGDLGDLDEDLGDHLAWHLSKLKHVGLQPYYQKIQQIGTELLYAQGNFQAKFESALRFTTDETYVSAVGGIEYTINDVGKSGADLGLIAEYLYDDRSNRQPFTPFDNDVFGGIRVGFNDERNTSLLAGIFFDVDTSATIGTIDFSTRINDSLRFGISGNVFNTDGWNDPLAAIAHDSYLDFKLTAYF